MTLWWRSEICGDISQVIFVENVVKSVVKLIFILTSMIDGDDVIIG
jgi:hypothetical protein